MTKVSVVIPLFNKGKYVAECIRSVLDQSHSPDEIIIVDDCSTDDSVSVVREFQDARIKIVVNDINLGTARNANRCMDLASDGFLIRQDADDVMPVGRIEKQVSFLSANPEVALVAGKNQRINETHSSNIILDERTIKEELFFTNSLSQPSCAMNLDLIIKKNIRYEENGPSIGEDWLFFYKLSKHFRLVNLNEVFNFYRIHEGNISDFSNPKYDSDIEKVIRYIFEDAGIQLQNKEYVSHLLFRKKRISGNEEELILNFSGWIRELRIQNQKKSLMNTDYLEKRISDAADFLFYSIIENKQALKTYSQKFPMNNSKKKYLFKMKIKRILGIR